MVRYLRKLTNLRRHSWVDDLGPGHFNYRRIIVIGYWIPVYHIDHTEYVMISCEIKYLCLTIWFRDLRFITEYTTVLDVYARTRQQVYIQCNWNLLSRTTVHSIGLLWNIRFYGIRCLLTVKTPCGLCNWKCSSVMCVNLITKLKPEDTFHTAD
jgi:hypothetical protein